MLNEFKKLERKRHIGNDIVTIVFQDLDDNEEPDFNPSSARSQFQHIFALVTFNKKDNSYRYIKSSSNFANSNPKPNQKFLYVFNFWILLKIKNLQRAVRATVRTIVACSAHFYKSQRVSRVSSRQT